MDDLTHKQAVENLLNGDNPHIVEHPIDVWIELALYTDERSVRSMGEIVSLAVKRLKWELENVPTKWVHVREAKVNQLSHWVALQDKLFQLAKALDDIHF